MARYTFTQHEFEQLKDFFDKNDTYGGAQWLTQMMENWLEYSFSEDYQGEVLYNLPFTATQGVTLDQPSTLNQKDPQTYHDKPGIGLSEEVLQTLEMVHILQQQVAELQEMHTENGEHVPTIISTVEQYEEMKPQMDKEERVLVHTTFDKALSVL